MINKIFFREKILEIKKTNMQKDQIIIRIITKKQTSCFFCSFCQKVYQHGKSFCHRFVLKDKILYQACSDCFSNQTNYLKLFN